MHPNASIEDCAAVIDALRDEVSSTLDRLAEQRAENTRLRAELEAQKIDTERAALWAFNLSLHLHTFKAYVRDFCGGVSLSPHRSREQRVIGFEAAFDQMRNHLDDPEPPMPSADAIRAIKATATRRARNP